MEAAEFSRRYDEMFGEAQHINTPLGEMLKLISQGRVGSKGAAVRASLEQDRLARIKGESGE